MRKTMIIFEGEEMEVFTDEFCKCGICGEQTFYESEYVYADNPYDREVCPSCGYWANTVMSSDDL